MKMVDGDPFGDKLEVIWGRLGFRLGPKLRTSVPPNLQRTLSAYMKAQWGPLGAFGRPWDPRRALGPQDPVG